jgi:fructokinase
MAYQVWRGETLQYVLFVGEMLIDFIPNQPLSAGSGRATTYQPHSGGAVANAAVALARLGGGARFIGKLSKDGFGRLLLQTLEENRVDTHFVPFTQQGPTTLVLVTLQEDGQREFTFYRQRTADTLLEVTDLVPQAWKEVGMCHVGSVLLADEPARSATLAALEQARLRGLLVSFDVNIRPALWTSEAAIRETMAQVIAGVDLLKLSAEEAHYLDSGLHAPLDPADSQTLHKLGQKLLTQRPRLVILTRGPLGAVLMTARHTVEVVASTIKAVDTTGAGDAFMGAILYKVMQQGWNTRKQLDALQAEDLQEVGEFANRVAGISCTRHGGIASLPYLDEL